MTLEDIGNKFRFPFDDKGFCTVYAKMLRRFHVMRAADKRRPRNLTKMLTPQWRSYSRMFNKAIQTFMRGPYDSWDCGRGDITVCIPKEATPLIGGSGEVSGHVADAASRIYVFHALPWQGSHGLARGALRERLREELREYGAWDDDELQCHATNLARISWLAACDIMEEKHTRML